MERLIVRLGLKIAALVALGCFLIGFIQAANDTLPSDVVAPTAIVFTAAALAATLRLFARELRELVNLEEK